MISNRYNGVVPGCVHHCGNGNEAVMIQKYGLTTLMAGALLMAFAPVGFARDSGRGGGRGFSGGGGGHSYSAPRSSGGSRSYSSPGFSGGGRSYSGGQGFSSGSAIRVDKAFPADATIRAAVGTHTAAVDTHTAAAIMGAEVIMAVAGCT